VKLRSRLLLSGLLLVAAPFAANADLPGKHPFYLHALSDLRAARWLIEHRPGDAVVSGQEDVAVAEIDKAIGEIKRAAIDDGLRDRAVGHIDEAMHATEHAISDVNHGR
jgi:hypothetical protein